MILESGGEGKQPTLNTETVYHKLCMLKKLLGSSILPHLLPINAFLLTFILTQPRMFLLIMSFHYLNSSTHYVLVTLTVSTVP